MTDRERRMAMESTVKEIKQLAEEGKATKDTFVAAQRATAVRERVERLRRLKRGGRLKA